MDERAPEIDGYRILREIGAGATGIVYLAETTGQPSTRVALKRLHPHTSFHEKDVRRFLREARLGERLRHDHILPVLEVVHWGQLPVLVMDFVDGEPLSRWKAAPGENPVSLAEKLLVLASIADALDYAHRQGVIHRDVKPANIMVRADGHPFLIDFGMARALQVDSTITASGAVLGTPGYLPPEVLAASGGADFRSDVYSLGVSVFEVATGRLPFLADSLPELFERIRSDEPPSVLELAPHAPAGLVPIVARALEKRPQDRYESAGDLRDDLRRVALGLKPKTGRVSLWVNRELRSLRRARMKITAAVIVGLLATLGGLYFGYSKLRGDLRAKEIDEWLDQGYARLDNGELDGALDAFGKLDPLEGQGGRAALARADAFAEFRMWQRASQSVREARASRPSSEEGGPEDSFHGALLAYSEGDLESARAGVERTVAGAPRMFRAYLFLELLERKALRFDAAREALVVCRRNLKEVDPRHAMVSALIAGIDGKFADAIALLDGVASSENVPTSIHQHLGYACLTSFLQGAREREDLARAERELLRATELEPDDGYSWSNLAVAHYLLGEREEARLAAERALACDERLDGANRVLAMLDAGRQDWESSLRRLSAIEPVSAARERLQRFQADVLYREGLEAYDAGRHEAAVPILRRCVENNSLHLAGWFALASAHSGLDESELALGEYRRCLELLREDATAPASSWPEIWEQERELIRTRHAADVRVGCLGSAAKLARDLTREEREDCRACLEGLREELLRGTRLGDVTAINLAEALVLSRDAELGDVDLACELVRRNGLRSAFPGNVEAAEILAGIDEHCR